MLLCSGSSCVPTPVEHTLCFVPLKLVLIVSSVMQKFKSYIEHVIGKQEIKKCLFLLKNNCRFCSRSLSEMYISPVWINIK